MKYAKKDSKNDLSMLPVAPIIINTPRLGTAVFSIDAFHDII